MKAYVIKNKEGKYLFFEDVVNATVFETKEYAELKVFGTGLTDYKIVPITICEGDLEEENRVLKRALELACLELFYKSNIKTIQGGAGEWAYWEVARFMQEAKEEQEQLKKIDEFVQQAKESENDENN